MSSESASYGAGNEARTRDLNLGKIGRQPTEAVDFIGGSVNSTTDGEGEKSPESDGNYVRYRSPREALPPYNEPVLLALVEVHTQDRLQEIGYRSSTDAGGERWSSASILGNTSGYDYRPSKRWRVYAWAPLPKQPPVEVAP